jgi:hypothetical protein
VATPFEHRPITTELALCQRYLVAVGTDSPPASTARCLPRIIGVKTSSTAAQMSFDATNMRTIASPTITVDGNISDLAISVTDGTSALSSISSISGREGVVYFVANYGSSAATNKSPVHIVQASSAGVRILVDAEL